MEQLAVPKPDTLASSKSKSKSTDLSSLPSARLPPPSLFHGPPSRNSSKRSLHLPGIAAAAVGLPASASASASASPVIGPYDALKPSRSRPLRRDIDGAHSPATSVAAATAAERRPQVQPLSRRRPTSAFSRQTTDANAKSENDRADALWAEMQNTLAEVEISATNGSHIFGEGHAKALEELRMAQLALAKAWARSEKDEVGSQVARDAGGDVGGTGGKEGDTAGKGAPQQKPPEKNETKGVPWSGSTGQEKQSSQGPREKTLEEETENDILLAKMRREANDRYFEQVSKAVADVVSKLDEVAGAMRKVEKESRDIWSDEEDDQDGSESISASTVDG